MSDHPENRGAGRPRVVETPEFAAAVEAAVAARLDAMMPELMGRLSQAVAPAASDADPSGFAKALALQLSELTAQGTGIVRLDPAIVEARRRAADEMADLLLDNKARRIRPVWRLVNAVQLYMGPQMGAVVIDPIFRDAAKMLQAQEIEYSGVPNLAMEPVDAAAKEVFRLFCLSIGYSGGAPKQDRLWALSSEGTVLRGDMNEILSRSQPAAPTREDEPAVVLRGQDKMPVRKVQVLGTLTRPVEVS